jgi:hypothetical protein
VIVTPARTAEVQPIRGPYSRRRHLTRGTGAKVRRSTGTAGSCASDDGFRIGLSFTRRWGEPEGVSPRAPFAVLANGMTEVVRQIRNEVCVPLYRSLRRRSVLSFCPCKEQRVTEDGHAAATNKGVDFFGEVRLGFHICPGGTEAISRWLSEATPPATATEKVLNPEGIPEDSGPPTTFRKIHKCLNDASVILPG